MLQVREVWALRARLQGEQVGKLSGGVEHSQFNTLAALDGSEAHAETGVTFEDDPMEPLEPAPSGERSKEPPKPPRPKKPNLTGKLLHLNGQINGIKCSLLLDTGADENFIHPELVKGINARKLPKGEITIKLGNGQLIKSKERIVATVDISGSKFETEFQVLDIGSRDAILGLEWFENNGVVMDFAAKTLTWTDPDSGERLTKTLDELCVQTDDLQDDDFLWLGLLKELPELNALSEAEAAKVAANWVPKDQRAEEEDTDMTPEMRKELRAVLDEFSDVLGGLPPKQAGVPGPGEHAIDLLPGTKPISRSPYRMDLEKVREAQRQITELLKLGFIQRSQSPWAAPILFVDKPDGSFRMCIDYRALNNVTIKNAAPLPRLDDLFDRLRDARYFSALDLEKGYHQMDIKISDIPKTAFRTPLGHFEFKVMPFGLCNAPASFQTMMDKVYAQEIGHFISVYLDDVLIYSSTWADHMKHLAIALTRLKEHRLYCREDKCSFAKTRTQYVGHVLSHNTISCQAAKIRAIQDWPELKDVRGIRRFLGLAGYYRKFVKDFALIARPLTDLLRKGNSFVWGHAQRKAFQLLKQALTHAPVLQIPSASKPFVLDIDASTTGFGAVLLQPGDDDPHKLLPVAFWSHRLSDAETKYAPHQLEMSALIGALRQWTHLLMGKPEVIVRTDNSAVRWLYTTPQLRPQQRRWLDELSEYNLKIFHIPGTTNVQADALSRMYETADAGPSSLPPPVSVLPPTIDADTVEKFLASRSNAYQPDGVLAEDLLARPLDPASQPLNLLDDGEPGFSHLESLPLPPPFRPPTLLSPHGDAHARHLYTLTLSAAKVSCFGPAFGQPPSDLALLEVGGEEAGPSHVSYRVNPTRFCELITRYGPVEIDAFASKDDAQLTRYWTADQDALKQRWQGQRVWFNPPFDNELIERTLIHAFEEYKQAPHSTRVLGMVPAWATARWHKLLRNFVVLHIYEDTSELLEAYDSTSGSWRPLTLAYPVMIIGLAPITQKLNVLATVSRLSAAHVIDRIIALGASDRLYKKRRAELEAGEGPRGWEVDSEHNCILRKGQIYVPPGEEEAARKLRQDLISEAHTAQAHLGREKTLARLSELFWWDAIRKEVEEFCKTCPVCMRSKGSTRSPAGLLKPLPLPSFPWESVAIDFVGGFPKEGPKGHELDQVMTVTDRLSKRVRLIPIAKAASAEDVAALFFREVVVLFGVPSSIVCDRDTRFTSAFWKELMRHLGTNLLMSTSYHPQTDGQSERTNRTLLDCMTALVLEGAESWLSCLPVIELAYNSSVHASTNFAPYEADRGSPIRLPLHFLPAAMVDLPGNPLARGFLEFKRELYKEVQEGLKRAQEIQKKYADKRRRDVRYEVGDRVLLDTSIVTLPADYGLGQAKLKPKWIGPYKIKKVLNNNAYELELPEGYRIRSVINVSRLKRAFFSKTFSHEPLAIPTQVDERGDPRYEIEEIVSKGKAGYGATETTAYFLKYKGYPYTREWAPESELLTYAPELLKAFEKEISAPRRSTRRKTPWAKYNEASPDECVHVDVPR